MLQSYAFEMIGTAVFAITGVLAVTRRGLDVFGAMVLGVVTAIGGGTLRDLIIRVPVFWTNDFNYVWAALAGGLAAFSITPLFRTRYRILLYLDGLGAALFAIAATQKVLALQMSGPIAVTMGILTGIGGGLIRDVLAGRPTLLMSREIYATPILIGCTIFVLFQAYMPDFALAAPLAATVIFGLRAFAIHRGLEIPAWLTYQEQHKD